MTAKDIPDGTVDMVYNDIKIILEKARGTAYMAVNSAMVGAYWQIGKIIVEEEQEGAKRAGYGKSLIKGLARKLTLDYGKGFTERNLRNMRGFYITFPKWHAVRAELTWTHYRLLLRIEKEQARQFYLAESVNNNWSTRELERQINSLLN